MQSKAHARATVFCKQYRREICRRAGFFFFFNRDEILNLYNIKFVGLLA